MFACNYAIKYFNIYFRVSRKRNIKKTSMMGYVFNVAANC